MNQADRIAQLEDLDRSTLIERVLRLEEQLMAHDAAAEAGIHPVRYVTSSDVVEYAYQFNLTQAFVEVLRQSGQLNRELQNRFFEDRETRDLIWRNILIAELGVIPATIEVTASKWLLDQLNEVSQGPVIGFRARLLLAKGRG